MPRGAGRRSTIGRNVDIFSQKAMQNSYSINSSMFPKFNHVFWADYAHNIEVNKNFYGIGREVSEAGPRFFLIVAYCPFSFSPSTQHGSHMWQNACMDDESSTECNLLIAYHSHSRRAQRRSYPPPAYQPRVFGPACETKERKVSI